MLAKMVMLPCAGVYKTGGDRFFKGTAGFLQRKREREFRRKSEFRGKKIFEKNIKKNVKFEV
jgi:hypothetical protein